MKDRVGKVTIRRGRSMEACGVLVRGDHVQYCDFHPPRAMPSLALC